mgnify:CR=1 FL=1
MRSKTQRLALNGVIAAAYAALTLVASAMNLAYGPVQFRFSEALTVLPFLFPGTWPGLFVGCLVANLLSPYGPIDMKVARDPGRACPEYEQAAALAREAGAPYLAVYEAAMRAYRERKKEE